MSATKTASGGTGGRIELTLKRQTGFTLEAAFDVPEAGILVLFGPSGCGKTTVLRAVAGLERAQGFVRIGRSIWQDDAKEIFVPTYERSLGYVFQEASLFEHLNVEKNLRFGLVRTKDADGEARLAEAIELLGIGELLKRRVDELSGGERQRCAIARSLCLKPDVLLMDEPLSALDWARKREILPWLEKLRAELRIPILYVTHSADEMARLANRVIVLDRGSVLAQGPLASVMTDLHVPVSSEYGPSSIVEGAIESVSNEWRTVDVRAGEWLIEVASPAEAGAPTPRRGDKQRLRILARDVGIAREPVTGASVRNVLPAIVDEMVEESGAYALVRLRSSGGTLLARILRRSAAELGLAPGMRVWALVKAAAVVV